MRGVGLGGFHRGYGFRDCLGGRQGVARGSGADSGPNGGHNRGGIMGATSLGPFRSLIGGLLWCP